MFGFLVGMFDSTELTPHGFCLLWRPELIWLHVLSDSLIGISYYSIPVALAYFVWRRRDLEFGWIFGLFAAFILACGTTHLFDIWTLWRPDYATQGLVKAATAAVSVLTAILLWPLVPRALALPSPAMLRQTNERLEREARAHDGAAATLRASEERYRALYNQTPMPLHSVDEESRLVSVSDLWCTLLGYEREEALGRSIEDFLAPETIAMRRAVWARFQVVGKLDDTEFQFVRKDGTRIDTLVRARIERDARGAFVRSLSVVIDITERKRAEAALRHETEQRQHAEEALRQAQKMEAVGQLTGGIAHDFNNLLTVIIGNLETLGRRLPESADQLKSFVAAAMRGANRAAVLVSQLLAFSRRQPLDPRNVDLNRLVAGFTDLLHRTLGAPVAIETVLAAGLWRTRADPNQLENALLNLAINARDAMPGGGKLTIETANAMLDEAYAAAHRAEGVQAGQYVLLAVTDTGMGMPAETVGRAFEPFFTTKDTGQGSGLGLSMVYGFVKQSGGHVKIYSELGKGTTLKIYLPRVRLAETRPETPPEPAPRQSMPGDAAGETVLVVEDDPGVRTYAARTLRELGYRVLEAVDAASALVLLDADGGVAVLFTDVGLPGGASGRSLADEAARRRPQLKVLFTTGYARNAIVHNGLLDADVELLTKPFTQDELAAKVQAVLHKPTRRAP